MEGNDDPLLSVLENIKHIPSEDTLSKNKPTELQYLVLHQFKDCEQPDGFVFDFIYYSSVKKLACCVKSSFFQENDCVIYLRLFLLFAARGSVEDSAAPSSSGRLLHINFCNYKSVISENIYSPPPPSRGVFFWLEPASHLQAPVFLQTSR